MEPARLLCIWEKKSGFPQDESELNTPIGISDTTEVKSRLQYTLDVLPSDLYLARALPYGG